MVLSFFNRKLYRKDVLAHKMHKNDKHNYKFPLSKRNHMIENQLSKPDRLVGERRKHRRHFIDLPVDCCVIRNKTKGPIHVGIAENAGVGGLSVYLDERFSPGNRLTVELYYKHDFRFCSLKILTEVVWHNRKREALGYRHGLKSLKLENGGNLKLKSLLEYSPTLM